MVDQLRSEVLAYEYMLGRFREIGDEQDGAGGWRRRP